MTGHQPIATQPSQAISAEVEIVMPNRQTLRSRVLKLAAPVIGENFLETFLGIVDTLLVAQLGAAAIAGVGSALQMMFFVIAALSALAIGSTVLVAQAYGASHLDRASVLARQSLLWSVLISIPMAVVGVILAGPIIELFGMEPEATQIGIDYLQVTMATVVVMTTRLIGGGVLRGVGDARTPMVITAIANVINVFLAYGLIFGAFGLPEMGAVGSAWGSFFARAIALVMLLVVLWRGRNGVSIKGAGSWWPDRFVGRQVLHIGLPAATEQLLITTAMVVLTIVVVPLGTITLAAHRVAMIALSLSFLPGIGFAIAATTLVGQSIGAHRPAEGAAAARISTLWAAMWMGAMAVVFFLFATPIMSLFTDDPEMIAIGAAGLRVVALSQPFWAVLFVQGGGLRGMGNTKFPLRVNATGIWAAVGIAYILLATVGGRLDTVWTGFLVTSPIMAGLLWRRFYKAIAEEEARQQRR